MINRNNRHKHVKTMCRCDPVLNEYLHLISYFDSGFVDSDQFDAFTKAVRMIKKLFLNFKRALPKWPADNEFVSRILTVDFLETLFHQDGKVCRYFKNSLK
jgi:hypothetical protein